MTNHRTLEKHLNIVDTDNWKSLQVTRTRNVFTVKPTKNTPEESVDVMLRDIADAVAGFDDWKCSFTVKNGKIVELKVRAPLIMHLNGAL